MVVCEFGGFENVLRDEGILAIPIITKLIYLKMKGNRDGKSAKMKILPIYSAVVVNDHNMYPRPCLYSFQCFYEPFGSKTEMGMQIRPGKVDYLFLISLFVNLHAGGRSLFIIR